MISPLCSPSVIHPFVYPSIHLDVSHFPFFFSSFLNYSSIQFIPSVSTGLLFVHIVVHIFVLLFVVVVFVRFLFLLLFIRLLL